MKLLETISSRLKNLGIPAHTSIRKNEFHSSPLVMLLSLLRLANNPEDKFSLSHLTKSFYDLGGQEVDIRSVISRASSNGENLLRAWLNEVQVLNCSRTANQILKACASLLLNSLDYNKFSRLFIDLTKAYYAYDNDELLLSDYNEECCAWNSLLDDILKKYEGETIDINRFLREVDFNSKASDKPEGSVPCLTIQASKGMEFRHVYLIGLVEDYLPSWFAVKKGNSSAEMQEERRNCFAAITRTQECLTLTHSSEVFGKARAPSRFLYEMGYQSP